MAIAPATVAGWHATGRQREVAPARAGGRSGLRAALSAASTLVGRLLAVVAQAEEPDHPRDQQAHVQHAEADYKDPPLRAHTAIIDRRGRAGKPLRRTRFDPASGAARRALCRARRPVVGNVGGGVVEAGGEVGAAEDLHRHERDLLCPLADVVAPPALP